MSTNFSSKLSLSNMYVRLKFSGRYYVLFITNTLDSTVTWLNIIIDSQYRFILNLVL